jgi:TrmH family RNA methyltransferase
VERISSRQNAIVKRFRELRDGRIDGGSLLDGAHLLEEALGSGVAIEVAAFSDRLAGTALAARAEASGIHTVAVSPQVLSAISPVRQPSGVAAIARVPCASLEGALEGEPPLVVILHDVQDPGNVGTTIRTADACGATGVITTPGTADPLGWKSLRASMGSAFRVPIAAKVPAPDVESALRARGIPMFATVPDGGTPLPDADLTGAVAILAGSEGSGLPADLAGRSAVRLTIPMRPGVESLNVAIAASLILYEAARQRRR